MALRSARRGIPPGMLATAGGVRFGDVPFSPALEASASIPSRYLSKV
jgi:hypothetical protein